MPSHIKKDTVIHDRFSGLAEDQIKTLVKVRSDFLKLLTYTFNALPSYINKDFVVADTMWPCDYSYGELLADLSKALLYEVNGGYDGSTDEVRETLELKNGTIIFIKHAGKLCFHKTVYFILIMTVCT